MEIRAENIVKRYSGHVALKDFSITIKPGVITGLLGPNGAGKTTFIRILNQILQPDNGELRIEGEKLRRDHLQNIGYLPEERGLYKQMRVLSQLVYLGRLKGLTKSEAQDRTNEWLTKLGLEDWKNARVEQLSKGMAQKVQFASTVLHDPAIVILDEPFSGFDPINTEIIKQEVLAMKEAGKTIILSTHNMGSVEEICDEIILLNHGETILQGQVGQVRSDFRPHVYEIEFKGNIIGFTNALWAGYELLGREQLGNEHFAVRIKMLNDNTVNNLLNTVLSHVEVQQVKEILPGMHDIFIQAVESDQVPTETSPDDE